MIGLIYQHGRGFIALDYEHGGRDVVWKWSIAYHLLILVLKWRAILDLKRQLPSTYFCIPSLQTRQSWLCACLSILRISGTSRAGTRVRRNSLPRYLFVPSNRDRRSWTDMWRSGLWVITPWNRLDQSGSGKNNELGSFNKRNNNSYSRRGNENKQEERVWFPVYQMRGYSSSAHFPAEVDKDWKWQQQKQNQHKYYHVGLHFQTAFLSNSSKSFCGTP